MKIDYEWLFGVSCAEVVADVKRVTEIFDESSIADIRVTYDHTFTTKGRDQKIAVALVGKRGIVFEIRYWPGGRIDVNHFYIAAADVSLFSKY
ncbi:hypothetical protein [Paenibacillus sp. DMB5]|uniref:hypothetical protein n=1 Tax=Paenibacillus sp. DMB5 TaxID=1780103 RepID=UPI00076BEC1D|nr:hypothetical protein [Paenibacillus sp. DMB5]KUP24931.1 hypothetical protein AWJ19_03340 [Paenibacillus sp. DMB5]